MLSLDEKTIPPVSFRKKRLFFYFSEDFYYFSNNSTKFSMELHVTSFNFNILILVVVVCSTEAKEIFFSISDFLMERSGRTTGGLSSPRRSHSSAWWRLSWSCIIMKPSWKFLLIR